MRNFAWLMGAAVVAPGVMLGVTPVHAKCIPWSQARPIIAGKSLVPYDAVEQLVKSRTKGDVYGGDFCEDKSGFYYEVVVVLPGNKAKRIRVDARTGELAE